jgi:trigger factor
MILIDGQVARDPKTIWNCNSSRSCCCRFRCGNFLTKKRINNATTIAADLSKTKRLLIYSLVKVVGDVVTVNTKGLFEDDHQLMDVMKVS